MEFGYGLHDGRNLRQRWLLKGVPQDRGEKVMGSTEWVAQERDDDEEGGGGERMRFAVWG